MLLAAKVHHEVLQGLSNLLALDQLILIQLP